jgi:hypothetical protein
MQVVTSIERSAATTTTTTIYAHELTINNSGFIHLGLLGDVTVNTSGLRRGDHQEQRPRSFITSSS